MGPGEGDATPHEETKGQIDVTPGSRVRSYDFAHRPDCYVEGVVEEIRRFPELGFFDCARIMVAVDRRVIGDAEVAVTQKHVYPPVNGVPTLGGTTDGVEVLE